MLHQWQAVCNTVSDLTDPRFEPQTFRSRDEGITTQSTELTINSMLPFRQYCDSRLTFGKLAYTLNVNSDADETTV